MPHSRSQDLLLLLACGLPAACGPEGSTTTTATTDGHAAATDHTEEVDAALAACGPYAKKLSECLSGEGDTGYGGYSYLTTLGYCISYFGYASVSGDACGAAMADHFACLAALDCAALVGTEDVDVSDGGSSSAGTDESPDPCAEAEQAVGAACDFDDGDEVSEPSGSTSG